MCEQVSQVGQRQVLATVGNGSGRYKKANALGTLGSREVILKRGQHQSENRKKINNEIKKSTVWKNMQFHSASPSRTAFTQEVNKKQRHYAWH